MQKISDGDEVGEPGPLNRPIVLLAVSQKRLPGRVEETTRLRLGGYQRPEGAAWKLMVATQVRSSRTGPPDGTPATAGGVSAGGWRRHGRVGRCRRRRGRRPLELLHQTGHAPAVAERHRGLRLRVAVVGVRTHTDQTGDLILLGLRLLHAGSGPCLPRAQPSAVGLDDCHRRRCRHAAGQLPAAIGRGLLVPLPRQVGTHLLGQTLDVAAADRHVGGDRQGDADQFKGLESAGEREDASLEVGSIAMVVQVQGGPERKKSRRQAGQWQTGSW